MLTSFAGEKVQASSLVELLRHYECGAFDLVAVGRALLQDPVLTGDGGNAAGAACPT